MYGNYFKIDEGAFSIAPNPKYLYLSPQHQEALAHLLYGVTRPGGFVLITGEIGTGKTTICRSLFLEVPEETDIALIINPKLNAGDLLASICDELKISYSKIHPSTKTYINVLNEHLIKNHAEGRNTILIIDEAQNLSKDALELVRVLTNLETDEQKLLQIILIGQPELRDRLSSPDMEQLNQRITARFHLRALNPKQVKEYIKHRLKVGEGDKDLFSNSNINYIYKLTGGVPRLINVLCDRTLLGAYVGRKKKITNDIIQKAAREALGRRAKPRLIEVNWAMVLALSIAALLIGATVLIFLYEKSPHLFLEEKTGAEATITQLEPQTASVEKPLIMQDVVKPVQPQPPAVEVQEEIPPIPVEEPQPSIEDLSAEDTVKETVDENKGPDLMNFSPRQHAFRHLLRVWQLDYQDPAIAPCDFAQQHGLFCFQSSGDIHMLRRLNRPVVLVRDESYLMLEKTIGDVLLVHEADRTTEITWKDIQTNWQGDFEMLWRPLSTVEHIRPNSRGEFVQKIDQYLSKILNRPPLQGDLNTYEDLLVEEIRAFQRMQRIAPDGVIGPLTQIYMNNLVHSEIPKLR